MLPPLLKGTGVTCRNIGFKEGELPESAVGDVVIALGNHPLDELKKQGIVPKNRTIGSMRGVEKALPSGASLFVSYSFSIRSVDYSLSIDLCGDIKLAVRKLLTGSVKPPALDFQWVQDLTGVIEQLDALVASKKTMVDVAIDLETTGLVAYDKSTWIVTFQISLDTKSSRVIHFDQDFQPRNPKGAATCREELIWLQVNYILTHPQVSMKGANLKYDLNWLHEKWGIHCTNFKMDTLLVGSLLDENRSNSLKTHAHVYTIYGGYELELNQNYDIARPQDVPPDVLLPYCGYDTTVCLEAAEKMRHELVTYRYPATLDGVGDVHDLPMLANFYIKILHPAARAYEEVEQVGVLVDTVYYNKFKRELQADTKNNAVRALAMLPGRIKAKYRDNLDLSRAAMLGCFFFSKLGMKLKPVMFTPKPDKKTGLPKPSTAMEHFLKFEKNPVAAPFIKVVKEYKDISKTLSTYVVGFMKHLRYDDRFHAGYSLYRGALESDERDAGAVCFPSGELILTNRGYLPIEDVKINDLVISHTGEPKAVFDFIPNGIKPIKKVTLSNGLSLRTTNNHPYLSNGAWVNAEDLKVGDSVTVHSDVEVWKPVPDWGYSVSSWGRVKSHYSGKIIKAHQKGKWGHLKVQFARNGSQVRGEDRRDFSLHRLVALAFIPNPEGHTEVMHLNGIAWDNTVGNLAWGSGKTNRDDASQQGRLNKTRGSQAKLTWESVQLIRASTLSDGVLGKMLGVARESVRDARTGKRWNKDPQWTYPNNFYEASVVCIEDQEPEPTFGVSVADNYSHVSGGVVTHNTGRISITDPALQCLEGSTTVLTEKGEHTILSVVQGVERGEGFTVLTHTGEWKPVIGAYRNGVQPLLRITTKSGATVECTTNHPWLTDIGFVKADKLEVGASVWRYYEEAARGGGDENRALDSRAGLGYDSGRPSEIRLPVRMWNHSGASGGVTDCNDSEHVLWLLQAGQANNTWSQPQREDIIYLLVMAAHAVQMLQPERQRLQGLWGERDHSLFFLERVIRDISERHGGEATEEIIRQVGYEWELQLRQLQVGDRFGTGAESQGQCLHRIYGGEKAPNRVGCSDEHETSYVSREAAERVEPDSSPYHACQALVGGFSKDCIVSIEAITPEETFDLTIAGSHSFIANGMVVHNTVPKKTKWAKPLRRAYIAPPGFVVCNIDYGQGELRIAADLSGDPVMLNAYANDLDLHAVTGAGLAKIDFETFMSYKDNENPALAKIYEDKRQAAKGANFGLALPSNSVCLTSNGNIKIQDVEAHHKLWDGLEWVNHDGIIHQGWFEVFEWDGVSATPNHNVWTEDGRKIELQQAAKEGAKLARTASVSGKPILRYDDVSKGGVSTVLFGHSANGLLSVRNLSSSSSKGLILGAYPWWEMCKKGQVSRRQTRPSFRGTLRLYGAALQQRYTQAVKRLQREGNKVLVRTTRAFYSLGVGNIPCGELQGFGVRQDRQQRTLLTRKSSISLKFREPSQFGSQRLPDVSRREDVLGGLEKSLPSPKNTSVCQSGFNGRADNSASQGFNRQEVQKLESVATTPRDSWLCADYGDNDTYVYFYGDRDPVERMEKPLQLGEDERTGVRGVVRGTDYRAMQERNRKEAEELRSLGFKTERVRVYDILNAGPRRRFTCSGVLVSNCYGMGAEGYRDYAEIAYRHVMTLEEATINRDLFFETYKYLIPWHDRYKDFAKKYGYTHSPLGRIRHLPLLNSSDKQVASKELRRAVNSPVQGCLSDMSLWATSIMHREGLTKKAPVVMMCHDALVFYLPEDNVEYYAKRYKEIMENLPFEQVHWKPKVKFSCDVEIGPSWSALTKLKL